MLPSSPAVFSSIVVAMNLENLFKTAHFSRCAKWHFFTGVVPGVESDYDENGDFLISYAEEGTRTPTAFRPPAPKAGASANSATSAVEPAV